MTSVILLVQMLNKSQLLLKKHQLLLLHLHQLLNLHLNRQRSQSKDLLITINKAFALICSSQYA